MQLFEISESGNQLVITKKRKPVLIRAGLMFVLFLFFILAMYNTLVARKGSFEYTWLALMFLMVFSVGFTLFRDIGNLITGDTWIIDVQEGRIEHNGKVVSLLNQIQSVRASKEEGEHTSCFLAFQPTDKEPIIIDNFATEDEEWRQYVELGNRISVFTDMKFVQQETADAH